jgi:hypothetical protein
MTIEIGAPATVRGAGSGTAEARPATHEANTPIIVEAGQSMVGQPSAAVRARNAADKPLSILVGVRQPAP